MINEGLRLFSPFSSLFPKPLRLIQQFLECLRLTADEMQYLVSLSGHDKDYLGMTKSGISGCVAAAGLAETAEINSSWATGGIEDPEEYTRHSDFSHTEPGVKKESLSEIT